MKLLASVLMLDINFRRLANTRFERIIVICIKYVTGFAKRYLFHTFDMPANKMV